MEAQNMKLVVLVVFLAVCVGTCYGDLVDAAAPSVNAVKDATAPTINAATDAVAPTVSAAKDAAAPTVEAAAEKSESFAQWAYDKVSSGLGFKSAEEPSAAPGTTN